MPLRGRDARVPTKAIREDSDTPRSLATHGLYRRLLETVGRDLLADSTNGLLGRLTPPSWSNVGVLLKPEVLAVEDVRQRARKARSMQGVKQWARTRRSGASITLAVMATIALVNSGKTPAAQAIFSVVILLPLTAGLVWFVAVVWEDKTTPIGPRFCKAAPPSSSRQLREDGNARIHVDHAWVPVREALLLLGHGVRLGEPGAGRARRHGDSARQGQTR